MILQELPAPNLIKSFIKFSSGCNRSYGLFACHFCNIEFETRIERLSVMTGLCAACSNKRAGRIRAVYDEGVVQSRLHVTWANMKRRCVNPTKKEKIIYHGITLCDEWMDFGNFMGWANNNGYEDHLTIDRIDPAKGYSPDNCRFADYSTQAANRKITKQNKSGYIGVCFHSGAWRATVMWNRKQVNIGRFSDPVDAAIARDAYIIENELPHTLNLPGKN